MSDGVLLPHAEVSTDLMVPSASEIWIRNSHMVVPKQLPQLIGCDVVSFDVAVIRPFPWLGIVRLAVSRPPAASGLQYN